MSIALKKLKYEVIDGIRYREEEKAVKLLMEQVMKKDPDTLMHQLRVAQLAELMADRLKLSDYTRKRLLLSAKLHDIGKIEIPDNILLKPGHLTDEEYSIMKGHSNIGYEIARSHKELEYIANLILCHHERFDGKGYPLRLAGLDIPPECRILAVLDAYDAMTCNRFYRKGLPKETALEELRKNSGSQFDPEIVAAFIDLIKDNPDF